MAKIKQPDLRLLASVKKELAKPRIVKSVREKVARQMPSINVQSVAKILERELHSVIGEWLILAEKEPDLMGIPMNHEDRAGHLPQFLHDVISRLRLPAGIKAPVSKAAAAHGNLRHKQGYTVAMAVQESRILQVSIFSMLHKNVEHLELSLLLPDIATIADEVDAQLREQMVGFMAAANAN